MDCSHSMYCVHSNSTHVTNCDQTLKDILGESIREVKNSPDEREDWSVKK